MTAIAQKDRTVWENQLVKLIIVVGVFPVLAEVFHFLLSFPAALIAYALVHFGGHLKFWSRAFSIVLLLPACWGAFAICKWIWPRSS